MKRLSGTIPAIGLAAACWFFTFGIAWGNFWAKIALSVLITCLFAFLLRPPEIRFRLASVLMGFLSAVLLYAVFFAGNILAPFLIPGAPAQVAGIYALGEESSRLPVFLLLLFVTGPGEEIFWRGFLQRNLMERLGDWPGFAVCTLIYAGVHAFSLNLMLVMAALVAGAFWGGLFLWKRDPALVMVSHSLWSAFIFAVFPIK